MNPPVRIAITGAAGNIAYSLAFRVASGELLGPDQPVILHLLEITPSLPALEGVVMELRDCAFPLLEDIHISDEAEAAFDGIRYAFFVGAKPRTLDMERKDLLQDNGRIFAAQGAALNRSADPSVRVLVVGNPANTNARIVQSHAPDLPPQNITAMTRLDHNRGKAMLAAKLGVAVRDITRLVVWGNHSSTQYPDVSHALSQGKPARPQVDEAWLTDTFIPDVQQRGSAIIKARGASSAASAASAALDHMRDWVRGSPADDWVSMAVPSDGAYDIPEGIIYSFPVTCKGGEYSIVRDLPISEFSRAFMQATAEELQEEREAIADLL